MNETIISTLITAAFAFLGVYVSNRKAAALLEYRIKQLEAKVSAHNNLVERMYAVEEKQAITEEKIKTLEAKK